MDIKKLQVLQSVIREKSLSAAAEQIGYTPSGISRIINSLEEELGLRLLNRQSRIITPTKECMELLPAIEKAIDCQESLKKRAASLARQESGSLHIGIAYTHIFPDIFDCIRQYHQEHPGICIHLTHGRSSVLAEKMKEGSMDICIISRRPGSFDWITLFEDPLDIVLPIEWYDTYIKNDGSIDAEIVAIESFIELYPGRESDNSIYLQKHKLRPNTMFTATNSMTAFNFVRNGFGVTLNNHIKVSSVINKKGIFRNLAYAPVYPKEMIEIGIAVNKDILSYQKEFLSMLTEKVTCFEK